MKSESAISAVTQTKKQNEVDLLRKLIKENGLDSLRELIEANEPDPLLNPIEAAEYLDVSADTLAVWRSTGRYNIPFVKVGRLVRYRKSALDSFLDRRTRGAEV